MEINCEYGIQALDYIDVKPHLKHMKCPTMFVHTLYDWNLESSPIYVRGRCKHTHYTGIIMYSSSSLIK